MRASGWLRRIVCAAILIFACGARPGFAQETKSAAAAQELMGLLSQASLDSLATRVADTENQFVGALLIAGAQLLVVSGEYSAPSLLTPTLEQKNYRDVYIEIQSASEPSSKVFITDLGADGLVSRPGDGQPFDTYQIATGRTAFNGDWRDQGLSEDEYMARFGEADDRYAAMLTALIAELK